MTICTTIYRRAENRFLAKVSKDHSHDGTASATVNSFDEERQDALAPQNSKLNETEKEAFVKEKGRGQVSLLPPPSSPTGTFLAFLEATQAFMSTFPDTVRHLESKITQLLDDAKHCQTVEAQLALTRHEACRQAEQVRECYNQIEIDKAAAVQRETMLQQESRAHEERIAKLIQQIHVMQQAHEEQVLELLQAAEASRAETAMRKLKSEQKISQVLEDRKQTVVNLTKTLESERDAHRNAMAVQTGTVKQLRTQLGEWKDRADRSMHETTRLTQERATLLAKHAHTTDRVTRYQVQVDDLTLELERTKTELESSRVSERELGQYYIDVQAKCKGLETNLSKVRSDLQRAQEEIQQLTRQKEGTTSELEGWIQ